MEFRELVQCLYLKTEFMDFRDKLIEIERDFGFHKKIDWKQRINLVENLLIEIPNNVELNVRAIYILHNILVEEVYPDNQLEEMIGLLQKWFNISRMKFSENSEYLFFIGKILHISEWYFGLKDNRLAIEFQRKAMEKEPGNLLFEWAYRLSCEGDLLEEYLANQIITYDNKSVNWLKSKGYPGEYILTQIRMSNEDYLNRNL